MRKLCPNFEREDGLETVLEVPIPEEMFGSVNKKSWQNIMAWIRPIADAKSTARALQAGGRSYYDGNTTEIQLLLGVIGAPLIPIPINFGDNRRQPISPTTLNNQSIEASMAKYIVQQYVAGVGGEGALNRVESMCAMGKVRMAASEFSSGDEGSCKNNNRVAKAKSLRNGGGGSGEMGGFVLWKKGSDLWCLEMVVSGCKISAGSDGKVAWRQTPWHHSHASRGPPRPLRRFLQGLDPKSTAELFSNSICIGEKTINNEDCFMLKLEAETSSLRARSTSNIEIIRHTVWGYFSQRRGLLVQLEDSHLLRIKSSGDDSVFWETTMVSTIQDYRTIEGINVAHGGKTEVSLFRFGDNSEDHTRTRMEEVWTIEEFDFNVKGLSMDCFLPPSDMKKEEDEVCEDVVTSNNPRLPHKIIPASFRISGSKVVAIDFDDRYDDHDDEL